MPIKIYLFENVEEINMLHETVNHIKNGSFALADLDFYNLLKQNKSKCLKLGLMNEESYNNLINCKNNIEILVPKDTFWWQLAPLPDKMENKYCQNLIYEYLDDDVW